MQIGLTMTSDPSGEGGLASSGYHANPICAQCLQSKATELLAAIRRGDFGADVARLNDEQVMQLFLGAAVFMSERLPGDDGERTKLLFRTFARVHIESPVIADPPQPAALP